MTADKLETSPCPPVWAQMLEKPQYRWQEAATGSLVGQFQVQRGILRKKELYIGETGASEETGPVLQEYFQNQSVPAIQVWEIQRTEA